MAKPAPIRATLRPLDLAQHLFKQSRERLTTGRGRFSDDFSVPGQAYAVMVRSPHPHARIRGVDGTRAKAMPGVLGVFSGAVERTFTASTMRFQTSALLLEK